MHAKIIVGVDGSAPSTRAVRWTADYAPSLGSDVIVVFSVELPITPTAAKYPMPSLMKPEEREELETLITSEWCASIVECDVPFRVILKEGEPARALIEVANEENADLVVIGRRGLGGFAELVLGSTAHHLSHHLDRPLVLVP